MHVIVFLPTGYNKPFELRCRESRTDRENQHPDGNLHMQKWVLYYYSYCFRRWSKQVIITLSPVQMGMVWWRLQVSLHLLKCCASWKLRWCSASIISADGVEKSNFLQVLLLCVSNCNNQKITALKRLFKWQTGKYEFNTNPQTSLK